jgi:hypothetical protein
MIKHCTMARAAGRLSIPLTLAGLVALLGACGGKNEARAAA